MEEATSFYQKVLEQVMCLMSREKRWSPEYQLRFRSAVEQQLLLRGLGIVHGLPLPSLSHPVDHVKEFLQNLSLQSDGLVVPGRAEVNKETGAHENGEEDLTSFDDEQVPSQHAILDEGPFCDFIVGTNLYNSQKAIGCRHMWLGGGIMRISGREYVFPSAFLNIGL